MVVFYFLQHKNERRWRPELKCALELLVELHGRLVVVKGWTPWAPLTLCELKCSDCFGAN